MSERRIHYAWVIVAMSTLVVFSALGLARFGYSQVLPPMQQELGLSNTRAGALATANLVGYLALSAIGGALAARFGPRKVATVGLIVVGCGLVLTGLTTKYVMLAVWRTVAGIGSGAANISAMGLVAAWFSRRRRGLASGIVVAGSSIALIIVGPLVPRILAAFGPRAWRLCWYLFGAVTLALAGASYSLLRDRPSEMGLLPVGGEPAGVPTSQELSAGSWARVYRSSTAWQLGLVYVAFGFSYIIYVTFFSKHLIAEGGYTPQQAGRLFMVMGWFSLFCGLIWGTISDRIGRKYALLLVYLTHAVAFGLFALWPAPTGFTLSAILLGLSAWSIPAIMAAACGDFFSARMTPAALGFVTLFFGIGQALGPSVAGAIADNTGSFAQAYVLAAGVALLGAFGTLLLRSPSTPGTAGESDGR